MRAGSTIQ